MILPIRQCLATSLLVCVASARAGDPPVKLTQNPSPMVEHTRQHPRLKEERPPGTRHALKLGSLYVSEKLPAGPVPLFVHFHGAGWIAEIAASKVPAAV